MARCPPGCRGARCRSSRRAIRATATSRPTPRWCSPSRRGRTRVPWPRLLQPKLEQPCGHVTVGGNRGTGLHQHPPRPDRVPGTDELATRSSSRGRRSMAAPTAGAGKRVNVEYVSANPDRTDAHGPLPRRGGGRCACRAARISPGIKVTREYYINDAGAQVQTLARSALAALQAKHSARILVTIPEGLLSGRLSGAGRRRRSPRSIGDDLS